MKAQHLKLVKNIVMRPVSKGRKPEESALFACAESIAVQRAGGDRACRPRQEPVEPCTALWLQQRVVGIKVFDKHCNRSQCGGPFRRAAKLLTSRYEVNVPTFCS